LIIRPERYHSAADTANGHPGARDWDDALSQAPFEFRPLAI